MSERVAPFHCPYCAEEDLRPHEEEEGAPGPGYAWACAACARVFRITFLGLRAASVASTLPAFDSDTEEHT